MTSTATPINPLSAWYSRLDLLLPPKDGEYKRELFLDALALALDVDRKVIDLVDDHDLLSVPEENDKHIARNYYQQLHARPGTASNEPVDACMQFIFKLRHCEYPDEKFELSDRCAEILKTGKAKLVNKYKTPEDYLTGVRDRLFLPCTDPFVDDYLPITRKLWSRARDAALDKKVNALVGDRTL